ncbi:MAG: hypothetical protein [Bacteriophage sp.]|nr:MAG: hypothetical protein [Bacteriophage sp.]
MSLNHRVNNVANGRRLGARKLVMNTPATVHAQVWQKRVVYANADQNTPNDPLSFESLSTSKQDEPNYEYDLKGTACLLFDKYAGGIVHKNYGDNIPTEQTLLAQIEPYNIDLGTLSEQITNVPEWRIADGDILGLMIYDGFIVWYEVVGFTGQTVMADFGMKYVLNRRDELVIDPIKQEVDSRG